MGKIIHIIQSLSRGGASRALIAMAKQSKHSGYCHQIVSLNNADLHMIELANQEDIETLIQPKQARLYQEIADADIVQIHFWNNPEIYEFLRLSLSPLRLVFWFHIAGDKPPHVITEELLKLADVAVASSPYTQDLLLFQSSLTNIAMIYSVADLERLKDLEKKPHETFNVGYIGTANRVKMHSNYIAMSGKINIANLQLIVCGGDEDCQRLAREAEQLGVREFFDFRGYVEDIRSVIEELDVFGYPLCPENYSTVELVLQEVMMAGVPPVIFAYGGAQRTVIHNQTGLVVETEQEYQQAIEYLYAHPEERNRLGNNAKEYVKNIFNLETTAQQFNQIYQDLKQQPKHPFQSLTNNSSGAEKFIQSIGNTAPQFKISLTSHNLDEVFKAEAEIALSKPVLANHSGGGILHYQKYYPQDGYLRLWSGLVWKEQGQNVRAVAAFNKAIELSCNHWRVYWYLSQVAQKVKATSLIKTSLKKVIQDAPDFAPAQQMWQCYLGV
jgi:glycosyltransferase involved in cell wall biosynthesis/sulfur relay (sulfurtransferase) DsrC/TusE family protein